MAGRRTREQALEGIILALIPMIQRMTRFVNTASMMLGEIVEGDRDGACGQMAQGALDAVGGNLKKASSDAVSGEYVGQMAD